MADIVIPLRKAITAHGQEMQELRLREPTTADIRHCGYPMAFDAEGVLYPQGAVIAKYIGRLGNLPAASVDQLDLMDFNEAMQAILPFFGGSDQTAPGS